MPRPRFQFRLSTLLWITLAVACWFGGSYWNRRQWEIERAMLEFNLETANMNADALRREFQPEIQAAIEERRARLQNR